MSNYDKAQELALQAKEVRKKLLEMIHIAGSGHPGGSLSAADIMTALYFSEMRIRPEDPRWDERDRFVLSKGHVCPVLYTCLGLKGYFPMETLGTLRKEGSILQGHPDMKRCPGIDISTGSLGQGLSVGVGMALRAKRDHMEYRVYVLLGDGECDEGQIWEAVQTAFKYSLDNLVILVDHNGLQNDDTCEVVMPPRDLKEKFVAFGCDTQAIDGHNMVAILDALDYARENHSGKPHCIVLHTVKGKGVSFMENVVQWHGMAPDAAHYAQAIKEIEEGFFNE
ncbi:MAG: transketolase [Firmicutes bacterium]|nr:transketolase [Bacillota bacterium]